jgi:hypothetical protein
VFVEDGILSETSHNSKQKVTKAVLEGYTQENHH